MKVVSIIIIAAIIAVAFSSCSPLKLCRAYTPKLTDEKSVSVLEEVMLGGKNQTILIRSKDVSNPVLLYLHGGPRSTLMPFAHVSDRELEEKYVVVHWDQRGAGKSYNKEMNVDDLKIEQYLSDTYELIKYLCARFNKEKIFLVGHSWGSYLGIMTAYQHPELLYAYVGMGQVINMPEAEVISYNYVLEKAKEVNKRKAIKELEQIGLPPYDTHEELLIERKWLSMFKGLIHNCSLLKTVKYGLSSPEYSFRDQVNEFKGRDLSLSIVWPDFQTKNIEDSIKSLETPVYFLEGRHDYCVPSELVERFVKNVDAPHKEIIWFENSAHMMNIEEPELYRNALNKVLKENYVGHISVK